MAGFFKPVALFLLLTTELVTGAVLGATTEPPRLITSSYVTTVTVSSSSSSSSHQCYTKTILREQVGEGCPELPGTCAAARCIVIDEVQVHVPPADPQCSTTPTVTSSGPCVTCYGGCPVTTETEWVTDLPTTTAALATPRPREAAPSPDCLTTVYRSATGGDSGITYTFHPLTETRISLVDCAGCSLIISDVQGIGPQITHTATVTASDPTIFTTFSCK